MSKKVDIEKKAPEHCAQVRAEQTRMQSGCSDAIRVKMLCPYCKHPVVTAFSGQHSSIMAVCPSCEKEVFLPPIKFR